MLSEVLHDLIVQFIGASDHAPFVILTEKMEGVTLENYLKTFRPSQLDSRRVLELTLNMSRGMSFLHERGIIHKELRPENVLLSLDHEKLKLDFGVAREESLQAKIDTRSAALPWVARELLQQSVHSCDLC
ncbi:serine/threonine/tyrosine-protein kinase HT1-like [Macadamia integrifolia]|uniref:serine/threonine/tyrosine-protein kinase HT1-like n=1 Tax=Macadamia integrifolia TaxID=60698 RepID=UPI001C4F3530|nr:serine/threonine/tyrosine-protein kinase HT1-like [Macadamia integrifolia]